MAIGFNHGFSILKQTVRDFDYSRDAGSRPPYTKGQGA